MWARRSRCLLGNDLLPPYEVLHHQPASVLTSEVVTQRADHLVRHPQSSLGTSELMSQAKSLREDSPLPGCVDCLLVLLILLALSALEDQRPYVIVLFKHMTEHRQRPLPRSFLTTALRKRLRHDHEMPRTSSSDHLAYLVFHTRHMVPPVELAAFRCVDGELISEVGSFLITHPRSEDVSRLGKLRPAHALVAVCDEIHNSPR